MFGKRVNIGTQWRYFGSAISLVSSTEIILWFGGKNSPTAFKRDVLPEAVPPLIIIEDSYSTPNHTNAAVEKLNT